MIHKPWSPFLELRKTNLIVYISSKCIHKFVSLCLNSTQRSKIPHWEYKEKSYPILNVKPFNEWYLLSTFQRFYLLREHLPGVFGNSLYKSLSLRTHWPYLCVPFIVGLSRLSHPGPVDDHTGILTNTNTSTNTNMITTPNKRWPVTSGFDLRLMHCEAGTKCQLI